MKMYSIHRSHRFLEILELDEKSKCSTHADPFRHLISEQLRGWHKFYFDALGDSVCIWNELGRF